MGRTSLHWNCCEALKLDVSLNDNWQKKSATRHVGTDFFKRNWRQIFVATVGGLHDYTHINATTLGKLVCELLPP